MGQTTSSCCKTSFPAATSSWMTQTGRGNGVWSWRGWLWSWSEFGWVGSAYVAVAEDSRTGPPPAQLEETDTPNRSKTCRPRSCGRSCRRARGPKICLSHSSPRMHANSPGRRTGAPRGCAWVCRSEPEKRNWKHDQLESILVLFRVCVCGARGGVSVLQK